MTAGTATGWFQPQRWERDTGGLILSLGPAGAFDDAHVFAPCVMREEGSTFLWYCGSSGSVEQRVFAMGLATSCDGVRFARHPASPVLRLGGRRSILTPAILRRADGSVLRENGRLRLWFSSTDLPSGDGRHAIHETASHDGVAWEEPSAPQIEGAYAPTVLRDGGVYRMWFTDVRAEPWCLGAAVSDDGHRWEVAPDPVMRIDQEWEHGRLFYPTVLKPDGVYVMWYGSYSNSPGAAPSTALGLAVSHDGFHWQKCRCNPVFGPDRSRTWESHYTTSQSVLRLPDGSWRIWYASRPAPPFEHKYFAIGTGRWVGPRGVPAMPDPVGNRARFSAWQALWRGKLRTMLGIPRETCDLAPESRGQFAHDGVVLEKWVFTSEPNCRVPAVLYRPERPQEPTMPALVLTYGHGGSKSQPHYQYMAQVFAKLGTACLAMDPVGEEERHVTGGMGTRAHDHESAHERAMAAGRLIMGKLVWDAMRGIDVLLQREDIDPKRIGVTGNSLGGAIAGWMAALEPRLRLALVSGWAFSRATVEGGKHCTRVPNRLMRDAGLTWGQYLSLAAPHCAVRIANGDADTIIDKDGCGDAWRDTDHAVAEAAAIRAAPGYTDDVQTWYESGGGHRPYALRKPNLEWLVRQSVPAGPAADTVRHSAETNFGQWAHEHGFELERLYGTPLHLAGATVVDLAVTPLTREQLAVLRPEEIGRPEYTLEGWLDAIG